MFDIKKINIGLEKQSSFFYFVKNKYFNLILSAQFIIFSAQSQDVEKFRYYSYGAIPTWSGVAIDWRAKDVHVRIYDASVYNGHSEYVARGLGRAITFAQFKELVKKSAVRQYLAFSLFDLRNKALQGCTWAVRLEDYQFDDTPQLLASEIAKLCKLIQPQVKGFSEKGLIVLNNAEGNSLNINKVAPFIKTQGYDFVTVEKLIQHFGGKQTEILNGGEAVGYLRIISKPEDAKKLTVSDIAIYEYLPERIPPVAGIITLKPQTPLSHINLLAKNRKTFNMYANGWTALPQLKSMIGKLVRIDNPFGVLNIRETNAKDAEKFWGKRKRFQLQIPQPDTLAKEIVPLSEQGKKFASTTFIGAKAANYFTLRQHFPEIVREGYAIGFADYFRVLSQGAEMKINQLLAKKNDLSPENLQLGLEEIRKEILKAKVSTSLVTGIRKLIKEKYPNSRIRLRSSTNCEDLPEFNGAGLYESKGLDASETDEKLIKKILNVYAAMWSETAFAEREYYGIDHRKAAMAILINEAFKNEEANGVILVQKNNYGEIEILVNAQPGEHEVANPKEGEIPESFILKEKKEGFSKVFTKSNISPIFVENKNNDLILKQLKTYSLKTYELFVAKNKTNFGLDIEFKIVKNAKGENVLFFKQARLIGL